jgi:aspartyl-tRNA(Asn)/glutamyl-tRNA(Gln) amidotransferase subunit A
MIELEDLCYQSLEEISDLIARREVSPIEVTQAHLMRCERLNPTLNTFITLASEVALSQASKAEREIASGHHRGPLHGIPIAHKDMIDTAGVRTTYGSSSYHEHVPGEDATVVHLLREAGAVMIGKCNLDEFSKMPASNRFSYGPSRNPWDFDRSAGNSSGGSGAAVSAFLCCGTTGTDTGGSIRNPAACNGIVGLKPTNGRVSLKGVYPLAPSLDTVGPLARTVRDTALLFQAMAVYDSKDPNSIDMPVPELIACIGQGVDKIRLGLCPDLQLAKLDETVIVAFETAKDILRSLGARFQAFTFPYGEMMPEIYDTLIGAEAFAIHRQRFMSFPDGYGPEMRQFLNTGSEVPAHAYVKACQNRLRLRRIFETAMSEVDALILPVAPCAAPAVDGSCTVNGKPADFATALRLPMNILGIPALALPIGYADGLPIAMQIVGAPWNEAMLFRIGYAFEEATPDLRNRRPPNV